MAGSWWSRRSVRWRAAVIMGLIVSTYSTVMSQLAAGRIGRDAVVDWMVVAAIPLREGVLQVEPSWPVIAVGIAFHQLADFSWAVVFFGLLRRWTADLAPPRALLLVAVPWAFFTSSTECLLLVPVIPFWQPIFTLNQPYWIGFLVHVSAALLYPLFPWIRDRLDGRAPSPHRRFAAVRSSLAAAVVLGLGVLALMGSQDREFPRMGGDDADDQAYMRRMAAHHVQGIGIAEIAMEKAQDPCLRAIARLMAANRKGEIEVFGQWWRSWFDGPLPPATPEDHAGMPGMIAADRIENLRRAEGATFAPPVRQCHERPPQRRHPDGG